MTPPQVRDAVRALITAAEVQLGLLPGRGSDQQRMAVLIASGEPLPPDIYEITHAPEPKRDD